MAYERTTLRVTVLEVGTDSVTLNSGSERRPFVLRVDAATARRLAVGEEYDAEVRLEREGHRITGGEVLTLHPLMAVDPVQAWREWYVLASGGEAQ